MSTGITELAASLRSRPARRRLVAIAAALQPSVSEVEARHGEADDDKSQRCEFTDD